MTIKVTLYLIAKIQNKLFQKTFNGFNKMGLRRVHFKMSRVGETPG